MSFPDLVSWIADAPPDSRFFREHIDIDPEVDISSLTSWDKDGCAAHNGCHNTTSETPDASKFPVNHAVNRKIFLHFGDVCSVKAEALVNFTNETYDLHHGTSGRLLTIGGADLFEELESLDRCRSGEARMTKAFNLPARYLIHSVGPRYNVKYQTAAENTLHSCYREIFKLMVESGIRSVAVPCVYSDRKSFPLEDSTHIVLRTVRRLLERFGDRVDSVVIVSNHSEETDVYKRLLPLYFPRSQQEEAWAIRNLPSDTGNEYGETEIQERKIRISNITRADHSDADTEDSACIDPEIDISFCEASFATISEKRLHALHDGSLTKMDANTMYIRYLRQAQSMQFDEISNYNFIYHSGQDLQGRNILVFCAALFPSAVFEWKDLMLYIIKTLDPFVRDKYVILYLNAEVSATNNPSLLFLREMYQIFNNKYENTLDLLLVLHPGFLFKTLFSACWPLMSSHLWNGTVYLDSVRELAPFCSVGQLRLPEYVMKYDRQAPPKYM